MKWSFGTRAARRRPADEVVVESPGKARCEARLCSQSAGRSLAALVVAGLLVVGCEPAVEASNEEPIAAFEEGAASSAPSATVPVIESRHSALEAAAVDVVLGVERVYEGGELVEDRIVWNDPPEDIHERLDSGAVGSDGESFAFVAGAHFDGFREVRFQHIRATRLEATDPQVAAARAIGPPAPPRPAGPRIDPKLAQIARHADANDRVVVTVGLRQRPTTSLRSPSALLYASATTVDEARQAREDRLAARRAELDSFRRPLVERLEAQGATVLYSSPITNDFQVELPVNLFDSLATDPMVEFIETDGQLETGSGWDGTDMKAAGGTNTQLYISNGFDGQFVNPGHGNQLTAFVIDVDFKNNHKGFCDWFGPGCGTCGTRIQGSWNCDDNPCTSGIPTPSNDHGTVVAGILAGDFRDYQNCGWATNSDDWRRQRTGQAEEAELILAKASSSEVSVARAVDKALSGLPVDVLSMSMLFGSDTNCNGVTGFNMHMKAFDAYEAGIPWINHAGNQQPVGSECTLKGVPDMLSVFTVGGLGDSVGDCTASNYLGCDLYGPVSCGANTCGTAQGPVPIIVNGAGRTVTAIDVLAPAVIEDWYDLSGGVSSGNRHGTSFAQPQVAGAALLIKDWALDEHGTFINSAGHLRMFLLAMTDRANGETSYSTSGFHPRWGGGRFQARFFHDPGEETGPWGWESVWLTMSEGQNWNHRAFGYGPEPSTISQWKAYLWWAEDAPDDVADVVVTVDDSDCQSPTSALGLDWSYDVKKMVRLGTSAASEALCIRTKAFHVPDGETRRAHLFHYYSSGTTAGR